MSKKFEGIFSLGLRSAQLQLDTLFENCGGQEMVELLDQLGSLDESKQKELIQLFKLAVTSAKANNSEEISNEIEEELFTALSLEIEAELNDAIAFELVDKSKTNTKNKAAIIDFDTARKAKAENRGLH